MRIKSETQFLNEVESLKLNPVYLLTGSETEKKKDIIKKLKEKITAEFDWASHSASSENSTEVLLSDLLTPPLFSPKRIIVFDGFEKIKSAIKKEIYEYFKNPVRSTVLILLYNDDLKNYEIKKEYDEFDIDVVIFAKITEDDTKKELLKFFNDNEIKTDEQTINYISLSVINHSHLKREMEKILIYLNHRKKFSFNEAKELVIPLKEAEISEISQKIISKDREGFKKLIKELIDSREEPLYILATIEYTVEKILKLKMIYTKFSNPPYEICQRLSINRYDISNLTPQIVFSFSYEKLISALDFCLEAENMLKSQAAQDSSNIIRNVAWFISENLMNS